MALRCYEHELPYNGGMEELLLADMEVSVCCITRAAALD